MYLVQIHSFHSYNVYDCNHLVSEETGVQGGSFTSLSHPVTKIQFCMIWLQSPGWQLLWLTASN